MPTKQCSGITGNNPNNIQKAVPRILCCLGPALVRKEGWDLGSPWLCLESVFWDQTMTYMHKTFAPDLSYQLLKSCLISINIEQINI